MANPFQFSERLDAHLRLQGWYPERCCAVDYWIQELGERQIQCFPVAAQLLGNFGKLTIQPHLSKVNQFRPSAILFDPLYASSGLFHKILECEQQLGVELFPVGEIVSVRMLLVSEDGRLIGASDDGPVTHGLTVEDGLEALVFGLSSRS